MGLSFSQNPNKNPLQQYSKLSRDRNKEQPTITTTMNKPLYELFESNATDEEILASIAAGADVNATRPLPATQEEFDKICFEDGLYPFVTPMQFAVKQRRSEKIIRALAEAGADVNAFVKYADFSDKLEDAGIDDQSELFYSAVDQNWLGPHSPLCIALLNEDCERIELLGEFGADPYAVYMEGTSDERSLEEIALYDFDWSNSTLAHPEVAQSYLKAKAAFNNN